MLCYVIRIPQIELSLFGGSSLLKGNPMSDSEEPQLVVAPSQRSRVVDRIKLAIAFEAMDGSLEDVLDSLQVDCVGDIIEKVLSHLTTEN